MQCKEVGGDLSVWAVVERDTDAELRALEHLVRGPCPLKRLEHVRFSEDGFRRMAITRDLKSGLTTIIGEAFGSLVWRSGFARDDLTR